MSQTLTSLFVQLVFSTKNRERLITPEVEPDLFAYIGGILKNHQSRLLDAGGTDDHVHLLVSQSKNIALANLLKEVKGDSSSWIKSQGRQFHNFLLARWLWCFLVCLSRSLSVEAIRLESERAPPEVDI